jgi:hypothetical protein
MISSEHNEQVALVNWAQFHPIAKHYMIAIPNGGLRNVIVAAKLKKEGVRAGVSDLFMAYPCHGKSGLWIEMKSSKKGRLSESQKQWMSIMEGVGYSCSVCYGFEQAVEAINLYLKGAL